MKTYMRCFARFGTHGEVLPLVTLPALSCNFTKSNTPTRVFFMFLKLYKWYQIAQCINMSWKVIKLSTQWHTFVYLGIFNQKIIWILFFFHFTEKIMHDQICSE